MDKISMILSSEVGRDEIDRRVVCIGGKLTLSNEETQ
jgi:hypothetical protein